VNYSALKTLITSDPDGLGFAPYINVSDAQIAAMFNDIAGPKAAQISLSSIGRGAFLKGVIPATDQLASGVDTGGTAIPSTTAAKWQSRFNALRSGDDVIQIDAALQGLVGELITDGLMIQVQIDAFTKRVGSYAEVKFGQDTVVTWQDIRKALGA